MTRPIEKIVKSPVSNKRYYVRVAFDTDFMEKNHIEYEIAIYKDGKPKLLGSPIIRETFTVELDDYGELKEELNPQRDIGNLILAYEAAEVYKKKLEAWNGVIQAEEPELIPEPPELQQPVPIIYWNDPPHVREQKERIIQERRRILKEWLLAKEDARERAMARKRKDAQDSSPDNPRPRNNTGENTQAS